MGKGPNCVVSILHHHLETYCEDIQKLVIFCDNCVGQNKNNAVLSYLQWRVARKLNQTILFNFLLTGHTKFAPDRYFGIFKFKYATSNIDTYEDLLQCVVESSPSGHNKAVSAENVTWYQWDSYLKPFYRPLVGITQFHHFIICTDCVKTKKFADSEDVDTFHLLLKPIDSEMPETIQPVGLTLERQWYIYQNLRSLVTDPGKVDITAPLPKEKLVSKKQKPVVDGEDNSAAPLPNKNSVSKKRKAKGNDEEDSTALFPKKKLASKKKKQQRPKEQ